MRFAILTFALLLTGCVSDGGAAFVASIAAVPNALNTQDSLEFDLRKDLVRKSSELEFISSGSYSCGDPDDKFMIESGQYYRAINIRNPRKPVGYETVLAARKKLREKDALLIAFVVYGNEMKALTGDFDFAGQLIGIASDQVAALKKGGGLSEAGVVLDGLSAVLAIAKSANAFSKEVAVRNAAQSMEKGLAVAAKKLADEHNLSRLTHDEVVAFAHWDGCATERLRFYRDWFLPLYKKPIPIDRSGHIGYQGVARSSVIDFSREYRQYQVDREAFIARRPNYFNLINAVLDANAKILAAPDRDAVIAAGKALVDATGNVQPAIVTLSN